MTGYVLSPRAQADLDEIWDYTEQRWRAAQAERYIRQLQQGIELMAADPRRGQACDEIRTGYRKYGIGSHVIFYRLTADGIDVVRILHASMDFDHHL
jgi:toxin ParE1/3/4